LANKEHLTLLRQGVKAWNEWRKENPEINMDLRGAHLEGAFLWEANLQRADLRGANLERADLRGAHLEEAYLGEAHLERADLRGAHLEGANLREAKGVTQEQINSATGDKNTKLPEGLEHPEHWREE